MKNLTYIFLFFFIFISNSISSQTKEDSTLIKRNIEQVNINALRASENTPVTFTNISKNKIEEHNLGQDIPYLLSNTTSIVTTSDAGSGIGYTGFRLRGTDQTRINVTINGVPLNDPESQGVWWVNMPDFATSIENIQIQRGVGTSTNGAASFGASINLKTNVLRTKAYAKTNNSFGSFRTLKNNIEFGTGLINNKFSFDGRLSRISSDGYIDRATSDLKSFYISGGYYGNNNVLKAIVFSGKEKTYQAWNGVPLNFLDDTDLRTYNTYTYENEIDNYGQTHYQLHFNKQLNSKTNYNIALHYTKGAGYYEQFKSDESLSDYGLSNILIGSDTIKKTDLIRRKWLDNDFYGTIFSLKTSINKVNLTLGGGWNKYFGRHFGEIIWAEFASDSEIREKYYNNDASKKDFNIYAKFDYKIDENFNLFIDLQNRQVYYSFMGYDENIYNIKQSEKFNFFNPKLGLFYNLNKNKSAYASFAIANKEPNRNDFVESSIYSRPKHETLYDTEIGYNLNYNNFNISLNSYYMIYKDQLVLTGEINDVGAYTRTNIDYSERKGIEIEINYKLNEKLIFSGNTTISKNKISNFTEYIDNWDTWSQEKIEYEDTDISFSPKLIWSSLIDYKITENLNIQFISKYVGEQFIDNTSSDDRKLDSYLTHNKRIIYDLNSKIFETFRITLQLNNILNKHYTNNAWVYRFITSSFDPTQTDPYINKNKEGSFDMAGYFPQAGRNFLIGISIGI